MEGRKDGWMDGRKEGWMDKLVDGLTDGWKERWMDGWSLVFLSLCRLDLAVDGCLSLSPG